MKILVASLALAALAFGGFRLLGDGVQRPAERVIEPSHRIADELEQASAEVQAAREPEPWVRETNRLCRAEKRELAKLGRPRSLEDLVPYLRQAIEIAERYERRSQAIEIPPRYAQRVRPLERMDAQAMRLLRAMLRAAERRDTTSLLDHAEDAVALGHRANPLLRQLGLDDCAMPPSGLPA